MPVGVGLAMHDVRPEELGLAEPTARGMRDNPLHLAAFGDDAAGRERRLRALPSPFLPTMTAKGVAISER